MSVMPQIIGKTWVAGMGGTFEAEEMACQKAERLRLARARAGHRKARWTGFPCGALDLPLGAVSCDSSRATSQDPDPRQ